MIVFLLIAVAFIIAFVDMSDKWLDEETSNILYYDTDKVASSAQDSEGATETAEVEASTDTSEETKQPNAGNVVEEQPRQQSKVNESNTASTIPDDLESVIDDLIDLDSEEDEIQIPTQKLSAEETAKDVEDLFKKFNGGAG